MSPTSHKIRVGPDTLHRSLAGETILINLGTGLCFRLDEVGDRIWQLILELGALEQVEERMTAEFDADPDQIREDLHEFLRELVDKQLITMP